MAKRKSPNFFLIAGEPSGDRLGQGLLAGLKRHDSSLACTGVGGPAMATEGLTSLFPYEQLSIIGFSDVVVRLPTYLRLISSTARAVIDAAPDAMITIDCPDFSLRVAARVRTQSPRPVIVHYVAPSVWAWRPGRVARLGRCVDHVLALLPFEPEILQRSGVDCSFVGHPAAYVAPTDRQAIRQKLGIAAETTLILVLPGSRASELQRLCPIFGASLAQLAQSGRRFKAVAVAAPGLTEKLKCEMSGWQTTVELLEAGQLTAAEKHELFVAADLALAASGTVSIELAAAGTPMVIAYDTSLLSRWLISTLLRIDTVTLVNIVSETRAVPEFLGQDCRPERICEALIELYDRGPNFQEQLASFATALDALGARGKNPADRAADAVMELLA